MNHTWVTKFEIGARERTADPLLPEIRFSFAPVNDHLHPRCSRYSRPTLAPRVLALCAARANCGVPQTKHALRFCSRHSALPRLQVSAEAAAAAAECAESCSGAPGKDRTVRDCGIFALAVQPPSSLARLSSSARQRSLSYEARYTVTSIDRALGCSGLAASND